MAKFSIKNIRRNLLAYTLLFSAGARAQRQDLGLLLYNIGFGGITAGIGAVCNKPKGADWKKVLVKGFWQGTIGGALHYSGKKCLYLISSKQEIAYGAPAMLIHAAGNSIIENAAYNRPFGQSWNLNYGPVRLDYSFREDARLRVRFLPYIIYGIISAAPKGHLDWKASVWTGCLTFKTDNKIYFDKIGNAAGLNFGRATIYSTAYLDDPMLVQAHELGHYLQHNEYQVGNTILAPLERIPGHKGLKKLFSKYIYFDAPYVSLPYLLEGYHEPANYYRNFFELENERLATNKDVPL